MSGPFSFISPLSSLCLPFIFPLSFLTLISVFAFHDSEARGGSGTPDQGTLSHCSSSARVVLPSLRLSFVTPSFNKNFSKMVRAKWLEREAPLGRASTPGRGKQENLGMYT